MSLSINFRYHDDHESYFAKNWHNKDCQTADEVANYVTRYRTGCPKWNHGYRNKNNFLYADWMPIDIDDGLSLAYALNHLKSYVHVIGTTRSHQKPKTSKYDRNETVVCDRFRVFLKFEKRTYDLDDYEYTCKKWCKFFKADNSITGGQAMVRPCKIVSIKNEGKLVQLVDGKECKRQKKIMELKNHKANKFYGDRKQIPPWTTTLLKFGCKHNDRNNALFGISMDLLRIGYSEQDVYNLVSNSAIPACGDHEFKPDEMERTIRSAKETLSI